MSNSNKGLHGDNLRFLDYAGKFPFKQSELDDPDYVVMLRICEKLRNTRHLKLIYYEYPNDGNQDSWMEVQELKWRMQLSFAQPETLTIRVALRSGDHDNPNAYVERVLRAATLAESSGCHNIPIWFEIGNEPNLMAEGFNSDPAEFNAWFIAVVDGLAVWGFRHGYGYPGLSPYPGYLGWYNDPTTHVALDSAQWIGLHAYNDIEIQVTQVANYLNAIGYGHYPRILTEAGSLLSSRMTEFAKLPSLPVMAYHIFIVEGKSNGAWDTGYILTTEECRALESTT